MARQTDQSADLFNRAIDLSNDRKRNETQINQPAKKQIRQRTLSRNFVQFRYEIRKHATEIDILKAHRPSTFFCKACRLDVIFH